MAKIVKFDSNKIINDQRCKHSADTVKAPLDKRNVVMDKSYGAPRITKDGVTVAKEIDLEDKFENMGAQMVKKSLAKQMKKLVTEQLLLQF